MMIRLYTGGELAFCSCCHLLWLAIVHSFEYRRDPFRAASGSIWYAKCLSCPCLFLICVSIYRMSIYLSISPSFFFLFFSFVFASLGSMFYQMVDAHPSLSASRVSFSLSLLVRYLSLSLPFSCFVVVLCFLFISCPFVCCCYFCSRCRLCDRFPRDGWRFDPLLIWARENFHLQSFLSPISSASILSALLFSSLSFYNRLLSIFQAIVFWHMSHQQLRSSFPLYTTCQTRLRSVQSIHLAGQSSERLICYRFPLDAIHHCEWMAGLFLLNAANQPRLLANWLINECVPRFSLYEEVVVFWNFCRRWLLLLPPPPSTSCLCLSVLVHFVVN